MGDRGLAGARRSDERDGRARARPTNEIPVSTGRFADSTMPVAGSSDGNETLAASG
jgi:hypothetical protein